MPMSLAAMTAFSPGTGIAPQIIDKDELLGGCVDSGGFLCRQVLRYTGNETLADAIAFVVGRPLKIILIFVVAFIANRIVRRFLSRVVNRATKTSGKLAEVAPGSETVASITERSDQRRDSLTTVFRSAASIVIYLIAAILILGELGINLAPLIAGAGIAGIALGFGAQSLVKDFLSGIFMLTEDQYGVGDIVDVGIASGTVEKMTLRETVIRDVNGTVWHVPNGQINGVGNKSQYWARALLDIGVDYATDLRRAQEVILGVAEDVAADERFTGKIQDDPEVWGIENLAADSVVIRLVVQTEPSSQWEIERELRLRLKEALDAAGIEIPFPQTTVSLRPDVTARTDAADS